MTTTLEIRNNEIQVRMNGSVTVVARYDDSNGTYFYNEQLEKQYAVIETIKKAVKKLKTTSLETFSFYVEYFQGNEMDTRKKFTTVKAKDLDQAIEKVNKNFKNLIEIEEC